MEVGGLSKGMFNVINQFFFFAIFLIALFYCKGDFPPYRIHGPGDESQKEITDAVETFGPSVLPGKENYKGEFAQESSKEKTKTEE